MFSFSVLNNTFSPESIYRKFKLQHSSSFGTLSFSEKSITLVFERDSAFLHSFDIFSLFEKRYLCLRACDCRRMRLWHSRTPLTFFRFSKSITLVFKRVIVEGWGFNILALLWHFFAFQKALPSSSDVRMPKTHPSFGILKSGLLLTKATRYVNLGRGPVGLLTFYCLTSTRLDLQGRFFTAPI
jgi:hypothetical protein